MRLSLVGTKERYEKGILELYELLKNGKSKTEAIEELSVKYPERELVALYERITKLKQIKPYNKLKKLLKVLLWLFLFLKILTAFSIIIESGWNPWTSLLIVLLVPILNAIALYLIYSQKGYAYEMIFLFVIIGFNSIVDLLRSSVESQSLTEITFAVILIIASVALLITSYILKKNQPMELGILIDITNKHKIDFSTYA